MITYTYSYVTARVVALVKIQIPLYENRVSGNNNFKMDKSAVGSNHKTVISVCISIIFEIKIDYLEWSLNFYGF
jgi:hypothetical protein